MGESNGDTVQVDEPFEDDDIEILEGDVVRTVIDGMISIQFSERVHSLVEKSFDRTIVLKLLGRRIGYATLKNKVIDLWKPKAGFKLMDTENDYFLVSFRSHEDYRTIFAWIHLPELPAMLYKRSLIEEIDNCIGSIIRIDYQTESGYRGRFAQMAVRIDLNKPLVAKLLINGRLQVIEYESLPTIYFSCGKYDHLFDNCPANTTDSSATADMVSPVSVRPAES
ncbi:hypothetical protein V6N11_028999 [Hibiscus sabdariffa]|uniref:DUF4283 domain-containing protein n=1 Tax=Hibiscus sabdariffa TaxID=183260 RepID=A0ABR2NWG3_9ROSI